jgi:hypothetical protein
LEDSPPRGRRFTLRCLCAGARLGGKAPSDTASGATSSAQGALRDLSAFRAIALDTLRIAQTADFSAARKRMDELESTWNSAAPKLKPLAPEKWKKVDAAIDRAERELRFWRARRTDSVQSLQELVRTIDSIE